MVDEGAGGRGGAGMSMNDADASIYRDRMEKDVGKKLSPVEVTLKLSEETAKQVGEIETAMSTRIQEIVGEAETAENPMGENPADFGGSLGCICSNLLSIGASLRKISQAVQRL